MRYFPLDIESAKAQGISKWHRDFWWPVSSEEYNEVATCLQNIIFDAVREFKDNEVPIQTMLKLKMGDIYSDLVFLLTCLIDVNRLHNLRIIPVVSENSLLYRQIIENVFPECSIMLQRYINALSTDRRSRMKLLLKRVYLSAIIKIRTFSPHTFFLTSRSELVDAYCHQHGIAPFRLPLSLIIRDPQKCFRRTSRELNNIQGFIVQKLVELMGEKNIVASMKFVEYLGRIVKSHLACVESDLCPHRTESINLCKSVVLSSTGGKYINKLLAWFVQRSGGDVIRFDHGGERAFCIDNWWRQNEFMYTNRYVTFSHHSADCYRRNLESLEINQQMDDNRRVMFESVLSEHRLKLWTDLNGNSRASNRVKKIMFVPMGFRGEMLIVPNFSIRDNVYAHLMLQLFSFLKANNYTVQFKIHPKSPMGDVSWIGRHCHERIDGYFRDRMGIADAYIFTNIGTAFTEALFTKKPLIFLDIPPYRAVDNEASEKLQRACRIVKCYEDDNNKIKVDFKLLKEFLSPLNSGELNARKEFVYKYFIQQ